ncbi:MAG: AmmeMemoRadiSam system radical SAM enzyme [Anaerolineae bacterium]
MDKEAILWEPLADGRVHCFLCAQECRISPGRTGVCGVRENRGGTLFTLVYGEVVAANVDPIEKKPLYHYLPGTQAFSIATAGCNMRCRFCQNADISQASKGKTETVHGQVLAPARVVELAREYGCASIAYTYTEPTIFMEYVLAIAPLAVQAGLGNVFVTNGFMTAAARERIVPYLSAANVDLKSFRDDYYRRLCGARLEPVLETIRSFFEEGVETEVTTLVVPGENDSEDELRDIARFLRGLSPDIPWHLSRFFPTFELTDRPPTPVQTLRRAATIGREEGLHYVYLGNVPGEADDTICPRCGADVIRRSGWRATFVGDPPHCPACRERLPVVTRERSVVRSQ